MNVVVLVEDGLIDVDVDVDIEDEDDEEEEEGTGVDIEAGVVVVVVCPASAFGDSLVVGETSTDAGGTIGVAPVVVGGRSGG